MQMLHLLHASLQPVTLHGLMTHLMILMCMQWLYTCVSFPAAV